MAQRKVMPLGLHNCTKISSIFSIKGPVLSVEGVYNNDVLEGSGVVVYRNGEKLRCAFEENCVHGHSVLFAGNGSVKKVGKFWRGVPIGLEWNYLEGGGFVVGKVIQFIWSGLWRCVLGMAPAKVNGRIAKILQKCKKSSNLITLFGFNVRLLVSRAYRKRVTDEWSVWQLVSLECFIK